MAGKSRPSLRAKTLQNVATSNLSMTDKQCIQNVFEKFDAMSKADVVEVKHGKWILKSEIHQLFDDVDEVFYVECPFCKRPFYIPFEFEEEKMLEYARKNYPYCNCGAKMDGKDETEDA